MAGNASIRERVKKPPAPTMIESYYKPGLARAFRYHFGPEIWLHLAHCQMLRRQRIIGDADARRILAALLDLHEAGPEALKVDHALEDMYTYVERYLTATLGADAGGRLHTGRSRNDLHVTTWRMALRALMLDVMRSLSALRRAVLTLARDHAETVMPGYTHWQHAQPVTLGYYLLAFADHLARDFARCEAALRRTNRCPLGAGALATTAFPLDRESTAAALGFEGLVEVAYDAVANRDDAHEAISALAVLMTGLSRLATDLQAWSTYEYGFIELDDAHCSVSSIMPQKKNPAALEHIKAACAMVTGGLTATLSASKNTAFADVSDGVSALNEPVMDAAERTRRVLDLCADVLGAITVDAARMRRFAEQGYGTATELADVIVRESGMSFRMAHNIVASVVAEAIGAGRAAPEITAADLDQAAQRLFGQRLGLSAEAVRAALNPAENIRRRTLTGGPAPATMQDMLDRRMAALAVDENAVARTAELLDIARGNVFAEARALLQT
ncbi:MAG TPA: argininosuccinate lyase [Acetobacteraceae bacterium]|nr:argininosuccinate lyase [Acetobacteraceae bacterium]